MNRLIKGTILFSFTLLLIWCGFLLGRYYSVFVVKNMSIYEAGTKVAMLKLLRTGHADDARTFIERELIVQIVGVDKIIRDSPSPLVKKEQAKAIMEQALTYFYFFPPRKTLTQVADEFMDDIAASKNTESLSDDLLLTEANESAKKIDRKFKDLMGSFVPSRIKDSNLRFYENLKKSEKSAGG